MTTTFLAPGVPSILRMKRLPFFVATERMEHTLMSYPQDCDIPACCPDMGSILTFSVACWNGTFHKPSNRRECFSASSRHDEESALFLSSSPREVKVFVQSIDSLLLMWHHQFSSICFGFRRKNRIIPFSRITHEKNTILSLFPRMKMFIYAILNVALVSSCP